MSTSVRLFHIWRTLRRYGLQEFWNGKPSGLPQPRGERLRLALEELGTVFIKFGQALSTRPDVLPPDVAMELAKLQDQVPPFATEEAVKLIEAALGKPVDELFARFDRSPLAAASVAQVYTAKLPGEGGMEVVVKVLRPGIEKRMASDIALLKKLAGLVERFHPQGHRIRPVAIVGEYERVLFDELDLMREGGNAAQLRRNWLGSELIYHPLVFWDYTRSNVLVLERLYGDSVRELAKFREAGVSFQMLAERGVEIFFKQVFRDNFFHADMHPGNIFVDASNPARPSYLALDFGIVGSLTAQDQRYLAENFLAFFNRDYKRIAELHLESGWIPDDVRVADFEGAIRTVCEPIYGKPIKEISFGFFLLRLFQIAQRYRYQVQPQLVLLQKTLLQVEGLGRQLYPDLDLWKTAKPIMEDWMKKRLAPSTALSKLRSQGPALAETLPALAENALKRLERGESLNGGASKADFTRLQQGIEVQQGKTRRAVLAAGGLVAAALIYGYSPSHAHVLGLPVLSWLLGLFALGAAWRSR